MFVSKNEYHQRYSICKSCDKFNNILKQCQECRCFMPAKCKMSMAKCPNNLWLASTSTIEVNTLETIE